MNFIKVSSMQWYDSCQQCATKCMTLQNNKISKLGMWLGRHISLQYKVNFTFLTLVSCQQLSNILDISNLQFCCLIEDTQYSCLNPFICSMCPWTCIFLKNLHLLLAYVSLCNYNQCTQLLTAQTYDSYGHKYRRTDHVMEDNP